jgi:replication factor C large subunit
MIFTQKYKPKNLKEFVNQKESVEVFLKWINKWKLGSKALLFYGIPGVGKTALIHAYANEKNFEFIEMNASDFRSAQQIQEVLGQSMKQIPLFKKSKIFLIDEVDGIAGRQDLGGVGAIIKIIKESRFPVLLTANNAFNPKLRALRQYCQLVQFGKISIWDIEKRLKEICEKEKIKVDQEVLRQLAKQSKGDLRSAINDLESISQGKKSITAADAEDIGYREREINIFEVLRNIFKTQNALAAKLTVGDSDKDPDEIFWWIENNITNEYEKPEEIARAFDLLSKADIFKQRISSRQNWKFKAYMIDLMSGVATAKKEMYRKFTHYQYPKNIIILGRTKEGRAAAKEVLNKMSAQLHCSTRKTREGFLPFLRIMVKNPKFKREILESFDISKDDLKALK